MKSSCLWRCHVINNMWWSSLYFPFLCFIQLTHSLLPHCFGNFSRTEHREADVKYFLYFVNAYTHNGAFYVSQRRNYEFVPLRKQKKRKSVFYCPEEVCLGVNIPRRDGNHAHTGQNARGIVDRTTKGLRLYSQDISSPTAWGEKSFICCEHLQWYGKQGRCHLCPENLLYIFCRLSDTRSTDRNRQSIFH